MVKVNESWLGRTVDFLSRALDLRSEEHGVISGNLANLDTPGYIPRTLTFEQELQQALGQGGLPPQRTHPRHLPAAAGDVSQLEPEIHYRQDFALGNGSYQLDLDNEMARLAQNNLKYEATVQLVAKKLAMLRQAITEGGK